MPLNRQKENSDTDALTNKWIYRYGKHKSISLDRKIVFEQRLMKEPVKKFYIKLVFSATYQHQTNELSERIIRKN